MTPSLPSLLTKKLAAGGGTGRSGVGDGGYCTPESVWIFRPSRCPREQQSGSQEQTASKRHLSRKKDQPRLHLRFCLPRTPSSIGHRFQSLRYFSPSLPALSRYFRTLPSEVSSITRSRQVGLRSNRHACLGEGAPAQGQGSE